MNITRNSGITLLIYRFLLGACFLLVATPSAGQYIYLDSNGDGISSAADTLTVPGSTQVDIWLRTDHNRDGSLAICSSGQSLTLNSYTFLLEAIGGTVAWGGYINNQPIIGTDLGSTSTPTYHRAAFIGGTALAAGTYKLGTIAVLVTEGRPSLRFAGSVTAGEHITTFGSACDGGDDDNTMALGTEWTDQDGLGAPAQSVIFADGFEDANYFQQNWTNQNTSGGFLKWGRSTCKSYLGSYSVTSADGWCNSYPTSHKAALDKTLSLQRYYAFNMQFRMSSQLGVGDSLNVYIDRNDGTGWLRNLAYTGGDGAWTIAGSTGFDNSNHGYDNSTIRLEFTSNASGTGNGTYLDVLSIYGTLFQDLVPTQLVAENTLGGALRSDQETRVTISGRNDGGRDAGDFYMYVYADGNMQFPIRTEFVFGPLVSGASVQRVFYIPANTFSAGTHALTLRVDGGDDVEEGNENNNDQSASFAWQAPPQPARPDLIVESITAAATAKMGTELNIDVRIKNIGTATANGQFRIAWYRDLAAAPSAGQAPDSSIQVGFLSPDVAVTVRFKKTGVIATTWRMYAFVDYLSNVADEVSEGNNASSRRDVQWVPKTLVVKGKFQYYDSLWAGTTSAYCNNIMLLEWDGAKTDTLGAVSAQWATNIFEFPAIVNEDDGDHGFLDLFIRVNYRSNEACWDARWPNNWFVEIRTPLDSLWHYDSGGYTNVSGDTLDMGVLQPTAYGDRSALHLLKTISHYAWAPIRDQVPEATPIPKIVVRYAPGYNLHTSYVPSLECILVNGTNDSTLFYPDEWDDDVVVHEYGHHISRKYGFSVYGPGAGLYHVQEGSADSDTLAWDEGWSDFYAALKGTNPFAVGRGTYSNYGRGPAGTLTRVFMDLEGSRTTVRFPNLNTVPTDTTLLGRGVRWEGSIAAALWDLYDDHDDLSSATALGDSLTEGFASIWSCLTGAPVGQFESVTKFAEAYEAQFANPLVNFRKATLFRRIFLDHGIYAGRDSFAISSVTGGDALDGPPVRLIRGSNPRSLRSGIRYYVRDERLSAPLRFRIYNVRGQLIRTLMPSRVSRGVNEISWDGTSDGRGRLGAGVYFCVLECGPTREQAKITVLR